MNNDHKGVTAFLWIAHFFWGIGAAMTGSLPAVIWCLGVLAMLNWDEYKQHEIRNL